jgi:hypothetical protein
VERYRMCGIGCSGGSLCGLGVDAMTLTDHERKSLGLDQESLDCFMEQIRRLNADDPPSREHVPSVPEHDGPCIPTAPSYRVFLGEKDGTCSWATVPMIQRTGVVNVPAKLLRDLLAFEENGVVVVEAVTLYRLLVQPDAPACGVAQSCNECHDCPDMENHEHYIPMVNWDPPHEEVMVRATCPTCPERKDMEKTQ